MSELLKKQNYGVEVEFTGISRKMAADAVAEIIGTTASRPDHTCYQTRTIQDSQGRKWKVMRDSSINPIRNPIFQAPIQYSKCIRKGTQLQLSRQHR